MYKNILLITNFKDEDTKTLLKAINIAKSMEAKLTILHVDSSEYDKTIASAYRGANGMRYDNYIEKMYNSESKNKLENYEAFKYIASALEKKNLDVEVLNETSTNVAKTTLSLICPEYNIDLVICPQSVDSKVKIQFEKKTTSALIKDSSVDVLIIK